VKYIGNTFILGDSYSTFTGYIPKEYVSYYSEVEREDTDVNSVTQTWWHQVLQSTDSQLLKNCSYSGTTISNTGYNGKDCSHNSFIARFDKLIEKSFFNENTVDTLFLFGGTNDSWADSPVGELMYSDWRKEDLFCVLPAFCYLINRICDTLPRARIICILNTEVKTNLQESFKDVCEKYNVEVIQLEEIDKKNGHPTVEGMRQIKEQIMRYLEQSSLS